MNPSTSLASQRQRKTPPGLIAVAAGFFVELVLRVSHLGYMLTTGDIGLPLQSMGQLDAGQPTVLQVSLIHVVFAPLALGVGVGLLRLRRWARWTALVLASLALPLMVTVASVQVRAQSLLAMIAAGYAAYALYVLVYLSRPSVRRLFERTSKPATS